MSKVEFVVAERERTVKGVSVRPHIEGEAKEGRKGVLAGDACVRARSMHPYACD